MACFLPFGLFRLSFGGFGFGFAHLRLSMRLWCTRLRSDRRRGGTACSACDCARTSGFALLCTSASSSISSTSAAASGSLGCVSVTAGTLAAASIPGASHPDWRELGVVDERASVLSTMSDILTFDLPPLWDQTPPDSRSTTHMYHVRRDDRDKTSKWSSLYIYIFPAG